MDDASPQPPAPRPLLRGLCCNDDPSTGRAIEAILGRCGFEVVGQVCSAADTMVAAGLCEPDAVVLDLVLTGDLGLDALAALRAVAPRCAVVVISSLDTMAPAALDAGAYDFVDIADLRALERSLRRLSTELQLGLGASSPAGSRGRRSTKAPAS